MKRWIEKLKQMNFDKKMRLFISMMIILTAMIIMISTSISANVSNMKKSRNLVQIQTNTLSDNLQMNLENYYNMSITLMLDQKVQAYLRNLPENIKDYPGLVNDLRNNLVSMLNMQNHVNFISIIKNNQDEYLYKGNSSINESRFIEQYDTDYNNSILAGSGTMRISINNVYFDSDTYSVTIYQPIYDKNKIGKVIGQLCMSIGEAGLLKPVHDKQRGTIELEVWLVGLEGDIVFNSDEKQIGKKIDYLDMIIGNSGSFQQEGFLYVYEKIGDWNYYLISVIPMKTLTQDSIRTLFFLVVIIFGMVIISLFIGSKIISKSYQPMNELVCKMNYVSKGRLDVRMCEEMRGDDFEKMSKGFNVMMDRLNALVEQVKVEQHQVEQIRFNALQSQIQPHFLYNTLECIHWQSLMDGNKVVSTLVKALATYYRLCLSKGQDVIPLSQEIAHVISYLTIQNMRYDDIVISEIHIDEIFNNIQIPKMTLQPLIENAIYHGIKIKEGKKGMIRIIAFGEADDVIISVEDSGNGMTQKEIDEINNSISIYNEAFGYGVRNVNKRIEILFGNTYGLHYEKSEMGGITVQIRLPKTLE